jgi:hypothetical protein
MQSFKQYLDTKGKEFSVDPELLPYFALPYVPNPQEHPTFSAIFKQRWILDLRKKIEAFLLQALPTKAHTPALIQMAQAWIIQQNTSDLGKESVELLEQKEKISKE